MGTVKNMTTSCSWERTGCRTSALRNLANPRRRFSINAPSFDRWLPLTAVASAKPTRYQGDCTDQLLAWGAAEVGS